MCTFFYLYITLSFIADEMNELCGGVDIVVEEDGDKTDDGRYYYFGIYIKCICVIYAMDFSMNMYNISYLYYWSFIEMNRLLLCKA